MPIKKTPARKAPVRKATMNGRSANEVRKIRMKLYDLKDLVEEFVNYGQDYEIFAAARASNTALKKIQKLLMNVN